MSLLESVLETVFGKVHFMVMVGNKPAIELKMEDKNIIVDIKNPVLAIELGLEELVISRDDKNEKSGAGRILEKLKKAGYKITVKYKIFELEI